MTTAIQKYWMPDLEAAHDSPTEIAALESEGFLVDAPLVEFPAPEGSANCVQFRAKFLGSSGDITTKDQVTNEPKNLPTYRFRHVENGATFMLIGAYQLHRKLSPLIDGVEYVVDVRRYRDKKIGGGKTANQYSVHSMEWDEYTKRNGDPFADGEIVGEDLTEAKPKQRRAS